MKKQTKRIPTILEKIALDFLSIVISAALTVIFVRKDLGYLVTDEMLWWMLAHLAITCAAFLAGRVYRISYTYFGALDVLRLIPVLTMVATAEILLGIFVETIGHLSALLYVLLFSFFAISTRSAVRIVAVVRSRNRHRDTRDLAIVVGAGTAGATLIRELIHTDKCSIRPVALLDDDPAKLGTYIHGVRVEGDVGSAAEIVKRTGANRIIVAIPSASRKTLSGIYARCQMPGVQVQTTPGLYQLASGTVSVSQIRDVEVSDLLGREQIRVNLDEIMDYIEDKVVLVTGGGGSIGSELCRQIATHKPKKLIIFDIYENNAYDIEQELRRTHPELDLLTLIGSIRDKGRLEALFDKERPHIVFNAAAHKHVPLMETSPNEAVKNNVFGTLNMARCADAYGVARFVQISTDKAVNPTNIMGATKRICEMIVQTVGRHSKTEFVAVRFGNVLGSNGSVIPLFKKQIAEGGPVTVTHKDIIRYFMTIPEAVSLVLQAGAYAKGGEIYVLDMGEQVRIYDLAKNLIRLSGYEPDVDIEIKITGLRPGEKLYEERLMDEEGMKKTDNEMISIGQPLDIDEENLFRRLDELYEAAYAETDRMKELVHELVPTYTIDKSGKGDPAHSDNA